MPSSTSSSERAARRSLLALAATFVALNAAVLAAWLATPFSQVSEQRYLAAVDDHIAMLERSKGEPGRVILIGGSGVAFSISAQTLSTQLDRPVYNGGIQAGIGFRNLIDLYADHLDPDHDTIVLIPELELLADDARYSQVWCDVVFLRKALGNLVTQPRCVPHILYRTYQEMQHHRTGEASGDPVYRRSGFNAVGDLTSHLDINRPTPDFTDYRFPEISDAKLSRFEDYVEDELIARGFEVVYIPPAVPQVRCERDATTLQQVVKRLSRLSTRAQSPHDLARFCLASDMFFDGAGHLNSDGRVIQTENVRRSLADALLR